MKLYPRVCLFYIIWLVAVILIAILSFSTLPHSGKFSDNFWESFGNWDGGHFLGIAEQGYNEKFQYAFFPLYPLAIRAVSEITQNYLVAAVLISIVSTFLGLNILYKLVVMDFDKKIAEKVVLALLFFPTSFFLLSAYSEGLFFFLVVLTFYFLRQNKLFWATVFAGLSSATRLAGLAVVAGLLIEIGIKQGITYKNWYVLLSPLGFLLYCIYLYSQTGDPFYFYTAENHWQRTLTNPGVGFWETLKTVSSKGIIGENFKIFLDLIFAVFGMGFVLRAFRFLSPGLSVYSLFSISLPLFTPTLSSMPRFLLVIFPIFILMALTKNYYLQLIFQIIFLMLLSIFTALFITGYWVS